ncbi:hypothetical protein [Streptomyces sp. MAA16]|uniref:hypothetical protein n=1 Tax=Streptomyces sp. MAA16 TaxID=3035116 RepID=UPI002473E538|nr:hypothetical protein [Streptomyces sp. MAA16]MDH6700436.1 hypothetical protein [Streptomyces sp. MAA16]
MSPRPVRAWQHHVAEAETARRGAAAQQAAARITEALDPAAAEEAASRLAGTWTTAGGTTR